MRHVMRGWAAAFVVLILPASLSATPSPEAVSRRLTLAFSAGENHPKFQTKILEKSYVGFKVRTVVFSIRSRVYRVVFSSDRSVTVSQGKEGDLAAQTLWTTRRPDVTVEEIVNVIYSREAGRRSGPAATGEARKPPEADRAPERIAGPGTGMDLRWNQLMNRVARGETQFLARAGGGSADRGLAAATSAARMMDPCGQSRGGASPQRAVVSDIAQALVAAGSALSTGPSGQGEAIADRSRDYKKQADYSFTKDVNRFEEGRRSEEVFELIRQTRSDAYEIFRNVLSQADENAKDPYARAAVRNFRTAARHLSAEEGKQLVDHVLSRAVVDVTAFTRLRVFSPGAPVIFDRTEDLFYVDPTLSSPSEARYLLSLAVLYAWRMKQPEALDRITRYNDLRKKVSLLEDAILDENDIRTLAGQKADLDQASKDLLDLADELRGTTAKPE